VLGLQDFGGAALHFGFERIARVGEFEAGFSAFLDRERPKVLSEIASSHVLSDEVAKSLDEAVDAFRKGFLA